MSPNARSLHPVRSSTELRLIFGLQTFRADKTFLLSDRFKKNAFLVMSYVCKCNLSDVDLFHLFEDSLVKNRWLKTMFL